MADIITSTATIWVSVISASSAIIGVVATQIISAINSRKSDERKSRFETRKNALNKKIEIGEHFYHIFKESYLNIHRQRNLFLKEVEIETEQSIDYLNAQLNQIKENSNKLILDTSKYNITEIYYNIESSSEITVRDIIAVTNLMTSRIELLNKYLEASDEERSVIGPQYVKIQKEIFESYEKVAKRVERDLAVVRTELLRLNSLIEQP